MKLTKLYCDSVRFKNVVFNDGLNIVEGKILYPENLKKDSHNLGKSTLAELIDFMLLKQIDKTHFLRKKKKFQNYTFYLEILLNNGDSLTIKRNIEKNTKISILIHKNRDLDLRDNLKWTYKDLSLTSKDISKNPKVILNNLLDFNVMKDINYRTLVGYFLRLQADYGDVFRLSKFKGSDSNWKPDLFELLGYNKDLLLEKYKIDNELKEKEELLSKIEDKFSVDVREREKIKRIIEIKGINAQEIKSKMENFNFLETESIKIEEVVDSLENQIAILNSQKYLVSHEISKIKQSLSTLVTYDIDKTFKLFNECKLYFKESLRIEYEELIEFNNKLSNDRMKYLQNTLHIKEKEINTVNEKLFNLNEERKNKLSFISETKSFKKYQLMQNELLDLERNIESLRKDLENTDILKDEKKDISKSKEELCKYIEKLDDAIDEGSNTLEHIRIHFQSFLKDVTDKDAILYLNLNQNNNVEFNAEFTIKDEETNESKGTSYKKIMCACFDLALLVEYSSKSFIKFIYHDGVFESLDERKKLVYLNMVKEICETYNLQYILTALESDIPVKFVENNPRTICLELDDRDNYEGTLFGENF